MTADLDLGTATDFVLLATTSITNTGTSVVSGGLVGVTATNGTIGGFDVSSIQTATPQQVATAQTELQAAYTEGTTRPAATALASELGGLTLTPGLYTNAAAVTLASPLVLSGAGTYVFCLGAAFTVAAAAAPSSPPMVQLQNGATNDQVFWLVEGAFSLGACATFEGSVLGNAALAIGAGATVGGRLLTLAGALTLYSNTITGPDSTARLAQRAATERARLLSALAAVTSFQVELPSGAVVPAEHRFGESMADISLRVLADCAPLCGTGFASTTWKLFLPDSEGGGKVTRTILKDLAAAQAAAAAVTEPSSSMLLRPVFTLRPAQCGGQPRLDDTTASPHRVLVHFATRHARFRDIALDTRYTVRFYQHESTHWFQLQSTLPPQRQVWVTPQNAFVDPSMTIGELVAAAAAAGDDPEEEPVTIRILLCSEEEALCAQLV